MKKLLQFLLCFVPFLVAEAIQLVTSMGLMFIYMAFEFVRYVMARDKIENFNIGNKLEQLMKEVSSMGDVVYTISILAILVCGIVFFFWYRKLVQSNEKVGLRQGYSLVNLIYLIVLGIGAQFFVTGVLGLIEPFFQKAFEDYAGNMNQLLGANTILVLVFVIIIAPVTEELVFRGVIMRKLEKEVSFLGANLLQAILFGIYHFNLIQGIYAFLLGTILGYVVKKYRSLSASIILHSIINGMAFVVVLFGASTGLYITLLSLGTIVISISIVKIRKML